MINFLLYMLLFFNFAQSTYLTNPISNVSYYDIPNVELLKNTYPYTRFSCSVKNNDEVYLITGSNYYDRWINENYNCNKPKKYVGVFKYNQLNNSIDDNYLLIGKQTNNYPTAIGGKGSAHIVSCGIDRTANILYYIASNKWLCPSNYNSESSIVRVNITTLDFIDRTLFNSFSNKNSFYPHTSSYWDYRYINNPLTSTLIEGDSLWIGFDGHFTGIWKLNILGQNVELVFQYQKVTKETFDDEQFGMSGNSYDRYFQYIKFSFIHNNKIYFVEDNKHQDARLMQVDYSGDINDNTTNITVLEGINNIETIKFDEKNNQILILAGSLTSELFKYDYNFTKLNINTNCNIDFLKFPTEWGKIANIEIDKNTGFAYVIISSMYRQAGVALIDLNTFEIVADSHLKFGQSITYNYGNGHSHTYYQSYVFLNISFFNYYNGELVLFPHHNAYINKFARVTLSGCTKGKGIVLDRCDACLPGKYSNTVGGFCKSCLQGYSSNIYKSYNCIKCAVGRYSDKLSNIDCKSCPTGYFTNIYGSNSCKGCSKGKYSIVEGSSSVENCLDCDTGKISNVGNTSCDFCKLGEWAKENKECVKCPKGRYGNLQGLNSYDSCLMCPSGKYNDLLGITSENSCKDCFPGKIGMINGAISNSSCITCPEGKFRLNLNTCEICPDGWISNFLKTQCDQCGIGKWTRGKKECLDCPSGKFSQNLNIIKESDCIHCSIGKFNDNTGSTSEQQCKECPIGRIGISSAAISNASCTKCEEGYYRISLAMCDICPDGWISQNDRVKCNICELGKWANSKKECVYCPLGKFSQTLNIITEDDCVSCPKGKYSDLKGIVNIQDCKECYTGRVSYIQGATSNVSCIECVAGKYKLNLRECLGCPHGWSSTNTRDACSMCPVGKFSDENRINCMNCPTGYYNDILGLSFFDICKSCEIGKYSSTLGATNSNYCIDCPLGKYSFVKNIKTEGECKGCPIGFFKDNFQIKECVLCPTGKYILSSTIPCVNCPVGKYSNDISTNYFQYCESCPFGKFNDKESQHKEISCQNCPAGKWNSNFGSNSTLQCINCEVGKYSEEIGATTIDTCVNCDAGKYNNLPGANSNGDCRDCATGLFSFQGSNSCQVCEPGKYSNKMASISCNYCEIGKYTNEDASLICKTCPENSEQSLDKTYCICSSGSYNKNNKTYIECTNCPEEFICVKGTTLQTLDLKPNYWRANDYVTETYKCKNRFACRGGIINNTSDNLCNEGHKGPICDICEKGWAKDDGVCLKCPDNIGRTMSLTIVIPLVCILLIIFLIKTANPSNNKKEEVNGVVKIFMNYAQVFSLASSFQINWPSLIRYLFERAKEFSSPRVSFYSSDCAIGWSYYDKLTVYLLLPIVYILSATFVIFLISLCFCKNKKKKLKRLQSVIEKDAFKASQPSCLNFFLAWEKTAIVVGTFLSWPTIVEKTLEVLNCERIGDEYYLVKDVSVKCYDSTHYIFLSISYVALGLYGVGIPLLGFRLLYKYRYRLFDMQNRYDGSTPLSFLFLGYREKRWYYEFIIMGKKACLILISVFLRNHPRYQIIAASLLIQVSFFLHVFLRPYDTITSYGAICNKLESISLLSLVMTLSTGLFFGTINSGYELGLFEDVLIVLLLLSNGGIAFYFFIYFVVLGFKTINQHLKEKLQAIFNKKKENKFLFCFSGEKKIKIKKWAFSQKQDDYGIQLKNSLEKGIFVNYFKEKQKKLNVLNQKIDKIPKRRLSIKLDRLRSQIQVMEKQRCWNTVQNSRLYMELKKTVLSNKTKLTDKEKEDLDKVFDLYVNHGINFNKNMNNLYMSDLHGMTSEEENGENEENNKTEEKKSENSSVDLREAELIEFAFRNNLLTSENKEKIEDTIII